MCDFSSGRSNIMRKKFLSSKHMFCLVFFSSFTCVPRYLTVSGSAINCLHIPPFPGRLTLPTHCLGGCRRDCVDCVLLMTRLKLGFDQALPCVRIIACGGGRGGGGGRGAGVLGRSILPPHRLAATLPPLSSKEGCRSPWLSSKRTHSGIPALPLSTLVYACHWWV